MSPQSDTLNRSILDELTQPGHRLASLKAWLMNEVWTMERYRSAGNKPAEYLLEGEALVHHRETLLTLAGESLYDELAGAPPTDFSIGAFLNQYPGSSVVILDGCSIGSFLDYWSWPLRPGGRSCKKITVLPLSRVRQRCLLLNAWT